MGENACHAVGNFDREAGLADAARSCQCHEPDRSARQKIDQARRFLLSPKKARQNGWQINVRGMRLEQRVSADLFGERHGFNGRRETKFGPQHAAAGFVDVQCGAALIRTCQHAHQLTIGGFIQRVVFEQTANGAFGFSQLTGAFVKLGKLFQRCHHLQAKLFTLNE